MMTYLSRWFKQMPTNNMKSFDFEFGHNQSNKMSFEIHASFYEHDDKVR